VARFAARLKQIVLVRHGRSRHVHSGWIDGAEFRSWREAYEAAGIDASDLPPPALCAIAARSDVVATSVAPRAIESANLLAPGRKVTLSPLLRERELRPPQLGRMRLPLFGWALAIGVGLLRTDSAEAQRTREAADWLAQLAENHDSVVAVTHASFRSLLSRELVKRGWRCAVPPRKSDHWSAWTFTRGETTTS
jgi:broad specificity phosphatase PhoE